MLQDLSNGVAIVAILLGFFALTRSTLVSSSSKRRQLKVDMFALLLYPLQLIKKRAKAWSFLFRGPTVIQEGYDKAQGDPYEIFVPENRYVFISSAQHIREVDSAPDTVLSLQAAAKQLLQPKYTMHNFDWFDQRGIDGTPLVRTLRSLLTNHISEILPEIRLAASRIFDEQHDSHPLMNGAKHAPIYSMVKDAVVCSNALAFFGSELAHDKAFLKSATDFIENTLLIAEIIRLLPRSIAPIVGKILASRYTTDKAVHDALVPVAERRLEQKAEQKRGHTITQHKDCIQWIIETAPKHKPWSANRVVHELMALWFGSVHILTTTICFAVHDLCLHPEYIEPLREELESPQWATFEASGKGLPLLDSFIKESARTTPVESMSTRRLALQPFTLSGGWKIDAGEWVCTPAQAMMKDPAKYIAPQEFHGFRFVDSRLLGNCDGSKCPISQAGESTQFTDVTDWQLWGTGRMACPGRFYAAAAMKTVLGLFITKYDMQLSKDPRTSRWFTWRSFQYPKPSVTVILTPRPSASTP